MKKNISYIIVAFISIIIFIGNVKGASLSVTGNSYATVNNQVTVYVTFSSSKYFANIEASVSYDKSKLQLIGGSDLAIDVNDSSGTLATKTFSYTFRAIKTGTATVSVNGRVTELKSQDAWENVSGSKYITISPQKKIDPVTYSSNNNLKELSIDDYSISPEFDKDILEYSVILPADTEEIYINATKEDSTASISGDEEVSLQEGINKIEIKVTAENGNIKTYIINATVKEKNPIYVKVNGKKYTLVRKEKELPKINSYFEKNEIVINDEKIPSYYNENTKYNLVGLRDDNGNIDLYIYYNGEYIKYNEINTKSVILISLEGKKPTNYKEYSIKLNKQTYKVFKVKSGSRYALIYGYDLISNKKDYYMYDIDNNTLQKYNKDEVNILTNKLNQIKNIMYVAASLAFVFAILSIVLLSNKIKNNNQTKKLIEDNDTKLDAFINEDKNEKTIEIKKIDEADNNEKEIENKKKSKKHKKNKHVSDMASLDKTTSLNLEDINLNDK